MNKLLIHSKSIPASVTVGGVLFEAVAQDASGNNIQVQTFSHDINHNGGSYPNPYMGEAVMPALGGILRVYIHAKDINEQYWSTTDIVTELNKSAGFSRVLVASVIDPDVAIPINDPNSQLIEYDLSGAKDPTAVYSNQLVNAQTSSGQIVLNFNVAKSEPPNVNIALDWTITCDAGKEKGILSEIFNSISNSLLDVVDVSLLPNVKTLTSSYDITP